MTPHTGGGTIASLLDLLSVRRPAGSKSERRWIAEHIRPLGVEQDQAGNLYKRIGDAPILWSSHTDTVHKDGGTQLLSVLNDTVHVGSGSNCLGADNAAGVWLMLEMVRADVPGLYIWHREEESGGVGSSFIADHNPSLVKGIEAAIAFDRRGTKSIITHQFRGRTCSDAFGQSLADTLSLGMKLDDGGTFTDTASYADLVGECTNVSAGFQHEHSAAETLNLGHLFRLRDALITADFSSLKFERVPGSDDPDDCDWTRHYGRYSRGWSQWDDEPEPVRPSSLAKVVRDHPEEVADFLEEYGVTADELWHAVYSRIWR